MMGFRKWLELRTRRQQSLAHAKSALTNANMMDYIIVKSGWNCHACREDSYRIVKVVCQTSLAGERFYYRSPDEFAYLCPRCQTISRYSDVSGNKTHVDQWDPKTWRGRRDADAVVPP